MSIKIASLMVPAYIVPKHYGQTPEVYPTKTVDRWELELVMRAPGVVKHKPTEMLFHDKAHGRVEKKIVIRYDFAVETETTTLAEIIGLAVVIFDLKTITAMIDDTQVEDFTRDAAEELGIGVHPWAEQ